MSRLSIEVSPNQHKQIKAMAALEGKSIKDFIIEKVLPSDEENQAMNELKRFLKKRMDLADKEPGSDKSIFDLTNDFLKSRS